MLHNVSALYVDAKGSYPKLIADCWDIKRDAMLYAGPNPVIAHPPCQRWCRLAGLVEARWGYKRGDDGGTFKAALASVRQWGGVLEHPAYSDAWAAHGMAKPRDRRQVDRAGRTQRPIVLRRTMALRTQGEESDLVVLRRCARAV